MSASVDRFALRQSLRAQSSERTRLVALPSSADVDRLANTPVDQSFVDMVGLEDSVMVIQAQVPDAVISARISELATAFNAHRVDRLFGDMRTSSLQSIAGTFGVGKMLSAYDKTGGSVDTIHNARQGTYATDAAAQAYEREGKYTEAVKAEYHQKDPAYRKVATDTLEARTQGDLKDAYTGEQMSSRRSDSHSIDHVIPAEEIHNDRGRVLAGVDGVQAGNTDSNLKPTSKTTNSAMGKKTATEYVAWLEKTKDKRAKRLETLRAKEAAGEHLSAKAKEEIAKLVEQEKITANPEPLLEADRKARAEYDKAVNAYYLSAEFRKDCLHTSVVAGGRAAFQAAMGAILVELFAGIFDEVKDWYRNGAAAESTIGSELKRRLKRVGVRVAKQWKAVLAAAAGGMITGLLSNLVTVLINAFLTTAKRTVRMIREGAGSLVSACKTLLLRPEGMTIDEGLHEASKVLVGGGVIVGGILLEEAVSKALQAIPFIAPIADITTAVIVGTATAITSTLAVYLVDKADVFGVNRAKRLEHINDELDASLEEQHGIESRLLEQFLAHEL
ncbi:hypothetical protein H8F21_15920 [Pseudomonas sp. P66]|uniref:Lactate permease n=1 Tax=Pseudomonas arcuscaelestis TaxID=2710591 RepID=A0ABS2BZK4_9PSED|nr:hypothetical protein [Pseudomonas arcuscaelestis]MBM5459056.1 hypothetical protein [Pseudomonas arcuscaelestis]